MSPDMLGQKPDQWDCYALYFLLAPSVDGGHFLFHFCVILINIHDFVNSFQLMVIVNIVYKCIWRNVDTQLSYRRPP